MSLWRLFKDKKTPEEIGQIRNARNVYYDGIKYWSDVIVQALKANLLTPETASEMSKLLMTDKEWLKNNPNAELEDIESKYQTLGQTLSTLQNNDKIRVYFLNYLKLAENTIKIAKQKDHITQIQFVSLKNIIQKEYDWYATNKSTASEIDYNTELESFNDKLLENGLSEDKLKEIQDSAQQSRAELKKKISADKKQIEKTDKSTITFERATEIVTTNASDIVYKYLFLVLRILSGCLAANMAIGRLPIYRLLYFIYGMIPFFTYLVLFYTIYRRIRFGPVPIYAILPLSLEPATTRLGRYLWYPFYWIPDQESMNAYGEFQDGLHSMVLGLSGVVMVSAATGAGAAAGAAAIMKGGALGLTGLASQSDEVRLAGLTNKGIVATGAVPSSAGKPGYVTAINTTIQTAKNLGSSAGKAVSSGVDTVKSVAGSVGDTASSIGSGMGGASKSIGAASGSDEITSTVKEIGDATSKTVQAAAAAGKAVVKGAVVVGSTAGTTFNAISKVTGKVSSSALGPEITNRASSIATKVGTAVKDKLTSLLPPLPF